jgi:hypothetical protein
LEEWTSVLKLSHFFGMKVLQSVAKSKVIGLPTNKKDWIFVLDFSMTILNLEIPEIRKAALGAISVMQLGPVEKILLGRRCKVKEWLIEGYLMLVKQEESIPTHDDNVLGVEATLRLLRMRDRCNWIYKFTGPRQLRGSYSLTCQIDLEVTIRTQFAKEIELVGDLASALPQEQSHVDLHHLENDVTRDEVFYFMTENIKVSDAQRLFRWVS